MTWPNYYKVGSGRRLPLNPNIYALSSDPTYLGYSTYPTLQAWKAARITGQALDTNAAGEVLLVPKGILHEETAASAYNDFYIDPASDSTDYFACIIGEDPNDRSRIQITQEYDAFATYAVGLHMNKNGRIYDCASGITTSLALPYAFALTLADNASVAVGCTNNDIIAPNITVGAVAIMTSGAGPEGSLLICCALDKSKTISVGASPLTGFGLSKGADIAINCVANEAAIGFLSAGAGTPTLVNCCAQGNSIANFLESPGTFTNTNPADEQGLSFDTDEYTLLVSDGLGLDESANPFYPFTDDINGVLWGVTWDRGCYNFAGSDVGGGWIEDGDDGWEELLEILSLSGVID